MILFREHQHDVFDKLIFPLDCHMWLGNNFTVANRARGGAQGEVSRVLRNGLQPLSFYPVEVAASSFLLNHSHEKVWRGQLSQDE